MHWQCSRLMVFAILTLALLSSGFAAARGAGGGNGGAGHSTGHGAGHGRAHHGASWRTQRGSSGQGRILAHGGWGLPGHGFYFVTLPAYCKRIYWQGVPYYFADDVYYEWNGSVGAYEQVQPPEALIESTQGPVLRELFVFPNGDQTIEQLERDRGECRRWAADQVGLDPTVATSRANFLRADEACLEDRDYSVE